VAASTHRNSGIRHVPREAVPDGCVACRGGTAKSSSWERPWDCAPPIWVTPCGPLTPGSGCHILSTMQVAPSSRGYAGSQGTHGGSVSVGPGAGSCWGLRDLASWPVACPAPPRHLPRPASRSQQRYAEDHRAS
jgi:hypothetical protein